MAMLGSKRIHIVSTDSRGSGLQTLLDRLNTTKKYMEIVVHNSATFEELARDIDAEAHLHKHPFDVVYIVGGATNITKKDRLTGRIYYEWGQNDGLRPHLTTMLTRTNERLLKYYPASKVIFCPLIGSELSRLVNAHSTTQADQDIVNITVWDFNTLVFSINETRGTYSPPLHHQVHRFCKGRRREYYQHLEDGIHLTESLKEKWANLFIKAMAHN